MAAVPRPEPRLVRGLLAGEGARDRGRRCWSSTAASGRRIAAPMALQIVRDYERIQAAQRAGTAEAPAQAHVAGRGAHVAPASSRAGEGAASGDAR